MTGTPLCPTETGIRTLPGPEKLGWKPTLPSQRKSGQFWTNFWQATTTAAARRSSTRRSIFYLQSVMADLDSRPELAGHPIKERAFAAMELLQQAADRLGISLKLNKKAKKG